MNSGTVNYYKKVLSETGLARVNKINNIPQLDGNFSILSSETEYSNNNDTLEVEDITLELQYRNLIRHFQII